LADLVSISKREKIPQNERAEARRLMKELYINGFLPNEIEFLTKDRWKRDTISKYCRNLEVKDTSEKDEALALMKEFVMINGSWDELTYYVKTKRSLDSDDLARALAIKCCASFYKLLIISEVNAYVTNKIDCEDSSVNY
jgi:hypothetical protein